MCTSSCWVVALEQALCMSEAFGSGMSDESFELVVDDGVPFSAAWPVLCSFAGEERS